MPRFRVSLTKTVRDVLDAVVEVEAENAETAEEIALRHARTRVEGLPPIDWQFAAEIDGKAEIEVDWSEEIDDQGRPVPLNEGGS